MGAARSVAWESVRAVDDNDRKERFSLAYICAVAAHAGYQIVEPRIDKVSVDGLILGDEDSLPRIAFQAKATSHATFRGQDLVFPLPVKNYNDLRREAASARILIVVVLPADDAAWLTQTEDDLRMRHCGYWTSLAGQPTTTNRRTVSVRIPRLQVFDTSQLQRLMDPLGLRGAS